MRNTKTHQKGSCLMRTGRRRNIDSVGNRVVVDMRSTKPHEKASCIYGTRCSGTDISLTLDDHICSIVWAVMRWDVLPTRNARNDAIPSEVREVVLTLHWHARSKAIGRLEGERIGLLDVG
jgi:hypothetical protein